MHRPGIVRRHAARRIECGHDESEGKSGAAGGWTADRKLRGWCAAWARAGASSTAAAPTEKAECGNKQECLREFSHLFFSSAVAFARRPYGKIFTMIVSGAAAGYAPWAQTPRCEPPLISILPPLASFTAAWPRPGAAPMSTLVNKDPGVEHAWETMIPYCTVSRSMSLPNTVPQLPEASSTMPA